MKKQSTPITLSTNKCDSTKKVPITHFLFQKTLPPNRIFSIRFTALLLFFGILLSACQESPQVKKDKFIHSLHEFLSETNLNAQAFSSDADWEPFDKQLVEQQASYQKHIHLMTAKEQRMVATLFLQYQQIKGAYYARRVEERLEMIKSGMRELFTPNTNP